jgi:hypothetical protein
MTVCTCDTCLFWGAIDYGDEWWPYPYCVWWHVRA